MGGGRGRQWGKVGVYIHRRQLILKSPNSATRDQLAIIELNTLECPALFQVVKRGVRYQWTVVQLENLQAIVDTQAHCQVTYALVGHKLAVGQSQIDKIWASRREMDQRLVTDQTALFKIHALKIVAILGQSIETTISELSATGHFQVLE